MAELLTFSRESLPRRPRPWPKWRKRHETEAIRIDGPFTVLTREGELTCSDGWLALDSEGWPYPIADSEFRTIYEPAEGPEEG